MVNNPAGARIVINRWQWGRCTFHIPSSVFWKVRFTDPLTSSISSCRFFEVFVVVASRTRARHDGESTIATE